MKELTFQAAFWSYAGQTIAFSIGLLFFGRTSNRILLWLLANLIGLAGVFIMGVVGITANTPAFAVILNLVAILLRGVALSTGSLFSRRNRAGSIAAASGALGIVVLLAFPGGQLRGLLIIQTTVAGLLAAYLYLAADRRSRGLAGTWQMQLISISLIAAIGSQLFHVYPIGEATRLFSSPQRSAFGATMLVVMGTVWQIAFLSLVTGRNTRERILAARRATRLEERSRQLRSRLGLVQELANERLNLLRLMSHEVRQPLNNAQAALHSVLANAPQTPAGRAAGVEVASRIQAILDDVILAISNSIIAASIIEWRRNPAMLPIAAADTFELAALDCSPEETGRIEITRPQDEVFPNADPALLRLALRNLLANALKYSPSGSPVRAAMIVDEQRHGVSFQITNFVDDAASLAGELFERGIRGSNDGPEGSGLGLFMVSETARLHHGSIGCWQLTPEAVTFELFIPL